MISVNVQKSGSEDRGGHVGFPVQEMRRILCELPPKAWMAVAGSGIKGLLRVLDTDILLKEKQRLVVATVILSSACIRSRRRNASKAHALTT